MRHSIVELAPVAPGRGKSEALQRAVSAAEEAEQAGYYRIWYAEHHHARSYASQDPVPLIALAAERTDRIRVGSGGVLLNHHSPFAVAERFLLLEALAPGRIDLGLGRSSAGPLVDAALRRDRTARPVDDFGAQVSEIAGYYHHLFGPDHPLADLDLTEGITGVPDLWVLGSSGASAGLAGGLGTGYTFGAHINPALACTALEDYRRRFAATPGGPARPESMLALNIVAADDEEAAHRLTWPARALRSLGRDRPVPTLRDAADELSSELKARPSTIRDGVIPPQISGTPESLRSQLVPLIRRTGATEVIVQDMLSDVEERRHSRALIAETLASIPVT